MNAYKIETMCQQTCLVPVIDKESQQALWGHEDPNVCSLGAHDLGH